MDTLGLGRQFSGQGQTCFESKISKRQKLEIFVGVKNAVEQTNSGALDFGGLASGNHQNLYHNVKNVVLVIHSFKFNLNYNRSSEQYL